MEYAIHNILFVFFCFVTFPHGVLGQVWYLSTCLVVNPIRVYSCGFPLNFTMVGQASDSKKQPGLKALVGWLMSDACFGWAHGGTT